MYIEQGVPQAINFYLPEKDHTAIGSTLGLVLRGSVEEFTVTVTIVFIILFLSFSSVGAWVAD